MNILTLEKITKFYSERKLFDEADFYLQEGEKVGIIGVNGTGKSTLLRMIMGIEEPDSGNVIKANGIVIRFLKQQPEVDSPSVLEAVMMGIKPPGQDLALEARAKQMLAELGITDFDGDVSVLSGGQRKRIALVNTFLEYADTLVMDEPTNHLDGETSQWLEDYLKRYKGAVILVTHDRYFLDSVVGRILEIDHGRIYSYDTNYEGFLELKAEREEMEESTQKKRNNLLSNELESVRRGAQARSTKQKARLQRYEELKNRKAPVRDRNVEISSISTRMGRTIIELENVSKAYERQLFKNFTYYFLKGDRIGFVGENGCGKTTLMKIIAGKVEPDSGSVVIGQTIKIGYYSQEFEKSSDGGIAYMDPERKVIDYIRDTAEFVRTKDGLGAASVMLDRFLFPAE